MPVPMPSSSRPRGHGFDPALVDAVLDAMLPARALRRPWLAGLSGLQGSGKSTLAAQLVAAARMRGIDALALSLDDVYFGRRERHRLALDVHALFATRGVPGTHDLGLLERTLDALAQASPQRPVGLPRFDKGRDTRLPPSRWRRFTRAPTLLILEGWCLGVPAQAAADLDRPHNDLERNEDKDGRWRRHVNAVLARDYARLWRRLDRLVVLQAPGFDVVRRWRGEQERRLRHRNNAPQSMDASTLARFIAHYERLSRHALRSLPTRADLVVSLDHDRRAAIRAAPAAGINPDR